MDEPQVIVGRNPVQEALSDPETQIEKILVRQGAGGGAINAIRRTAKLRGIPVQFVPESRLNKIAAGAGHQGVAALTAPVAYLEIDDLLSAIAADTDEVRARKPILLLLDGVQDPHNFGAILRSAVAAGVDGVVIPRHGMAPLSAVAIKASAGTAFRIPIARVPNLADALYPLKERGYWVLGADSEGEETIWTCDWDRPLAIVMGSEGKGLRRRVAEGCDLLISIPMRGNAESLNASVAAGIILFAAARERGPLPK
jgi:23S rRNA (guanosine2251-2'-O)-methyltransferase